MDTPNDSVPAALRTWFVVHFVADLAFAIPLFVAPRALLTFLGWHEVDPLATRMIAAALFGIGIQSFLGRNEGVEGFRGMLSLKVIWSSTATLGILLSIAQGAAPMAWAFAGIFAGFCGVWSYWRLRLRRSAPALSPAQ
jgi:hypothetical protein